MEYGFRNFPCLDRDVVMPKEGFVEEEGGLGDGCLVEMSSTRKRPIE